MPESSYRRLLEKIDNKTAVIGVVGLGQVGLPTALSFVTTGFDVLGFDINVKLINELRQSRTSIPEPRVRDLLSTSISDNKLKLDSSPEILANTDIIVVCVPTPLSENNDPNLQYLQDALEDITDISLLNKIVIIESSIPPLTMDNMVIPTLESRTQLQTPFQFLISFCPERIAPGQAMDEMSKNPRIIGIRDPQSHEVTDRLYRNFQNNNIIPCDFVTAEVSKLAENSFRDVNIAFANELANICQKIGVDVIKVIEVANTHPRVTIHFPGSGVGGPCLPKDPYLLINKIDMNNSIIRLARSVNDSMPSQLVVMLSEYLESYSLKKEKVRIGILGAAYKGNVSDIQYSPTKSLVSELRRHGYNDIRVHDPYCQESFGGKFEPNLMAMLHDSNCIVIATAHSDYELLTPSDFNEGCIVMDAVRILSNNDFADSKVNYIAPGITPLKSQEL